MRCQPGPQNGCGLDPPPPPQRGAKARSEALKMACHIDQLQRVVCMHCRKKRCATKRWSRCPAGCLGRRLWGEAGGGRTHGPLPFGVGLASNCTGGHCSCSCKYPSCKAHPGGLLGMCAKVLLWQLGGISCHFGNLELSTFISLNCVSEEMIVLSSTIHNAVV
jgi:hypothetical protein